MIINCDVTGWARKVGHQISASQAYHDRCMLDTFLPTDSSSDMFPEYRQPPGQFKTGIERRRKFNTSHFEMLPRNED